jgi:hypothetical protein
MSNSLGLSVVIVIRKWRVDVYSLFIRDSDV